MEKYLSDTDGLIEKVAAKNAISKEEVLREIQSTIDLAWNHDDPSIRARQQALFPNGKPSIDEFLSVAIKQVMNSFHN